jgi:hypothetical protein
MPCECKFNVKKLTTLTQPEMAMNCHGICFITLAMRYMFSKLYFLSNLQKGQISAKVVVLGMPFQTFQMFSCKVSACLRLLA